MFYAQSTITVTSGRHKSVPHVHRIRTIMHMCVCVHVHMHAVCVCVHACVCVCVKTIMCVKCICAFVCVCVCLRMRASACVLLFTCKSWQQENGGAGGGGVGGVVIVSPVQLHLSSIGHHQELAVCKTT